VASFLIGSSGGTAGRTVPLLDFDDLRLPLEDDLDREDDRLDEEERPPAPRPLPVLSEVLGDRDFDLLLRFDVDDDVLVLVCLCPTSSASAALKLLALDWLEDLSSFSFLIRDKFMSLFCNGAVFLASASGLSDRRAFRLGIPSGDEDLDLEREDLELPEDDRLPLRRLFGLLDLLEDDLEEDLEEPDE